MVYELERGQAVMVGNRQVESRQVRRFEFQSKTQWVDTVIESAPIEARVGTFNAVGSYRRLDGLKLTEFDTMTNDISESEIDEGVRFLVNRYLLPSQHLPLEEALGLTPTRVETGAVVCFRDRCRENAVGLLYQEGGRPDRVFADDSRGFPLRVGTHFVVRELRVDDERR